MKVGKEREFHDDAEWIEFLDRWNRKDLTRAEAIGLLHRGTKIFGRFHPPNNEELQERIFFYIDQINEPSGRVSETAQQLVIKDCLWWLDLERYWRSSSKTVPESVFNATEQVLSFLGQNPSEAVQRPPYPRFVHRYLLKMKYEDMPSFGMDEQKQFNRLHLPLVRAFCAWGLGYQMGGSRWYYGKGDEIITEVRAFLNQSHMNDDLLGRLCISWPKDCHSPQDDLKDKGSEIFYSAVIGLLRLLYFKKGGIVAKSGKHPILASAEEYFRDHPETQ